MAQNESNQQAAQVQEFGRILERFSETSRRALFFARRAVSEHGGSRIEVEHLLIGLVGEAGPRLQPVLSPGWSLQKLLDRAVGVLPNEPKAQGNIEVPFSRASRQTLRRAVAEADELKQQDVRPDHLLLALEHDQSTPLGHLLREAGLSREVLLTIARTP